MSASPLHTLCTLLSVQEQHPRQDRPGDRYAWECGCTFVYAVGGWRSRRVCQRHAHLAEDPRQVMVEREAA